MVKNQEEVLLVYQQVLTKRGINEEFSKVLALKMLDIYLAIAEETRQSYRGDIGTKLQLGVVSDVLDCIRTYDDASGDGQLHITKNKP